MMSLTATPSCSASLSITRIRFCLRCRSVCVANTHSHSLEPMPKASAPKAPCVEEWTTAKLRRHRVVGHGNMRLRPSKDATLVDQSGEALRARYLLHEVPVD